MHLVAVGGSDAGISAALRARELDPTATSPSWSPTPTRTSPSAASRTTSPARSPTGATSPTAPTPTWKPPACGCGWTPSPPTSTSPDSASPSATADGAHRLARLRRAGRRHRRASRSARPSTASTTLGAERRRAPAALDGRHLRPHRAPWTASSPKTALIVGAGYVGLEMAEGLTARGIAGHPGRDAPRGAPHRRPRTRRARPRRARPSTASTCTPAPPSPASAATDDGPARLHVDGTGPDGEPLRLGRRPRPGRRRRPARHRPARRAPAPRPGRAAPSSSTRPWPPACPTSGPPATASSPTTACSAPPTCRSAPPPTNKAASPARTPSAATPAFAGSLGTQVVKVFDLVAARTGLRDHEATAAGFTPATSQTRRPTTTRPTTPARSPITIRITGDTTTGQLLGAQLVGARGTETAKRVDTYATALFHGMTVDGITELDLSYTPPLGSPWDAVQIAAQAWVREHRLADKPASARAATRPGLHPHPSLSPVVGATRLARSDPQRP